VDQEDKKVQWYTQIPMGRDGDVTTRPWWRVLVGGEAWWWCAVVPEFFLWAGVGRNPCRLVRPGRGAAIGGTILS
jgi:hypothetical protein